jgi:pimeloyl-ACP methyl ester carboxylesterase
MPILRLDTDHDRPTAHRSRRAWPEELDRRDIGEGPAIVMIHGYKYCPGLPNHCPHSNLLSLSPDRPFSWPRQIGFGAGHADEGLGIAFGWCARGSLGRAQRSGRAAGRALAEVIAALKDRRPERPVHVIAHSMGTDVALEALHHLGPGAVQRVISLTGAVWASRAEAALSTPAGRSAAFVNVTSRENDFFDFVFERLLSRPAPGDRAIGHGLILPNAVTIQLDCPATLDLLARCGMPVAPPRARICHWSAYTRPGVLRLYNLLLRRPEALPLARLRGELPGQPAPRWSRLLELPAALPLPFAQKAS